MCAYRPSYRPAIGQITAIGQMRGGGTVTRTRWAAGGAIGLALSILTGWGLSALELGEAECSDTMMLIGYEPQDCPHRDHCRRVEWRFDSAYLICTCPQ